MARSFLIYGVGSGLFSLAPIEETTQEEVETQGKIYNFYDLGEVIHVKDNLNRLKNEFFHLATTIPQGGRGSARRARGTGRS